MKRVKLFVFIIVLTLVTPTIQVFAAELENREEVPQDTIDREYIISKVVEAFPEYSSKI